MTRAAGAGRGRSGHDGHLRLMRTTLVFCSGHLGAETSGHNGAATGGGFGHAQPAKEMAATRQPPIVVKRRMQDKPMPKSSIAKICGASFGSGRDHLRRIRSKLRGVTGSWAHRHAENVFPRGPSRATPRPSTSHGDNELKTDDGTLRRAVESLLPHAERVGDDEIAAPSPRAPTQQGALRVKFSECGLQFTDLVTQASGSSLRELCRYAASVPDRVAAAWAHHALVNSGRR